MDDSIINVSILTFIFGITIDAQQTNEPRNYKGIKRRLITCLKYLLSCFLIDKRKEKPKTTANRAKIATIVSN